MEISFFLTKKIYLQSIIDCGLFNDIKIHTVVALEAREIQERMKKKKVTQRLEKSFGRPHDHGCI